VSLVWYDPDPPAVSGVPVKIKKAPRVREATVGEDGTYRLCGLPEKYEGKLQAQRKDGGTTAEVSITQEDGLLALRSMSVAPLAVAAGSDSAGKAATVAKGARESARARRQQPGCRRGERSRDAERHGRLGADARERRVRARLAPRGTQALTVRHLGYAPTEVTVELSSRTPARVNVTMGPYVPVLETREVVSRQEQGLERVGWTTRKKGASTGYFMGPEQIEARRATQFTDLLTTTPGIRVSGTMGRMSISATRTAGRAGCVNVYVDGSRWQQLEAGDLDSFVRRRTSRRSRCIRAAARCPSSSSRWAATAPQSWCGRSSTSTGRQELMIETPIVHHAFVFALGPLKLTGFGIAMMAAFASRTSSRRRCCGNAGTTTRS
jgi:hypothetical protein